MSTSEQVIVVATSGEETIEWSGQLEELATAAYVNSLRH